MATNQFIQSDLCGEVECWCYVDVESSVRDTSEVFRGSPHWCCSCWLMRGAGGGGLWRLDNSLDVTLVVRGGIQWFQLRWAWLVGHLIVFFEVFVVGGDIVARGGRCWHCSWWSLLLVMVVIVIGCGGCGDCSWWSVAMREVVGVGGFVRGG